MSQKMQPCLEPHLGLSGRGFTALKGKHVVSSVGCLSGVLSPICAHEPDGIWYGQPRTAGVFGACLIFTQGREKNVYKILETVF